MKKQTEKSSHHLAVLIGALLAWPAGVVAAQDYIINSFDTPDDPPSWNRWWGAAVQNYEFDYFVDAAGQTTSGALKATVEFDVATYGGDNQFAVLRNFDEGATLDGTKYTNLVFDLRWDAASAKNADGNYGYLEYGFRNADWSQNWLGGMTIASDSGGKWIHVVAPINPTAAKLDTVAGVVLKLWSGSSGGLAGTTTFWVDNVKLIAKTDTAPPPLRFWALRPLRQDCSWPPAPPLSSISVRASTPWQRIPMAIRLTIPGWAAPRR